MVASMERARAALDALTQEEHGVDGRSICIYGEAWDFGEVACNQRGRNACQLNITGTGLGAGSANSLFSHYTCRKCCMATVVSAGAFVSELTQILVKRRDAVLHWCCCCCWHRL
jgi:hypothetical protein